MSDGSSARPNLIERALSAVREDIAAIRPRQHLFSVLSRAIPAQVGSDWRVLLLRQRGAQVGAGTRIFGTPEITLGAEATDAANLTIGHDCVIDIGCLFEIGDRLTIGDRVTLGHQVSILTTTHELGRREHRAGKLVQSPVNIQDGAWLGCRCVVLPGVTVGAGAIVEPGTVLNKDVPPHTRVGGMPAKKLEELAP